MAVSERWRKIPGWPYEAAYWGSGIRREGSSAPRKAVTDKDGYKRHTLSRVVDGRRERKTFGEHQLVALAWLGRPEVLHGRGGQQDNSVPNLRYGSRRANELDKSSFGSVPGRSPGTDEWGNGKGEKGIDRNEDIEVAPPFPTVSPVSGDVQR